MQSTNRLIACKQSGKVHLGYLPNMRWRPWITTAHNFNHLSGVVTAASLLDKVRSENSLATKRDRMINSACFSP